MKKHLYRTLTPIQEFFKTEASSGIILLIATLLALVIANTGLNTYYGELLQTYLQVGIGVIGERPHARRDHEAAAEIEAVVGVVPIGVGALDIVTANAADLVFRYRDGQQQRIFLGQVDARRLQLPVESHVGAAHNDGVDHIRLLEADTVDDRAELGMA